MTVENDTPVLELRNISVSLCSEGRRFRALSNFSFHMQRGEVTVILGDSGSGKSTLLHFVAGLLASRRQRRFRFGVPLGYIDCEQADGRVTVVGHDITDYEPVKRPVGLIPQQYSLYEHMTVEDNLIFPLKLRGESGKLAQEKVKNIAEILHIDKLLLKQRPNKLSGGQLQRVSLGKLLLKDPVLALLDESFAQIDPLIEDEIIDVLRNRLNDKRSSLKGIVIVTHDINQTAIANHIVLFRLYPPDREPKNESRIITFSKNGNCNALDTMKACDDKLFEPWCELVKPLLFVRKPINAK
jgi:ABC-type sugar transport system ATPase subunit